MKRFSMIAIALLCMALPIAAQTTFSTNLTGAAETTVCNPDGAGFAIIRINGTAVEYALLVQNVGNITSAHIHRGAAGTNGDIVVDLAPAFVGGNATGSVTASTAIANEILSNPSNFYVNVHTTQCASGAIRGQLAQAAGEVIVFPIVGSGPGASGTRWITDLRILNQNSQAVDVTLKFYAQSEAGLAGPTATSKFSVPAGSQMVLDNAIQSQMNLEQFGALEIVASSDVRADARILNDRRGSAGGTAGFAIEGFQIDEAATAGVLPLLSQGGDFRTNLGYYNPSAQPAHLTITARSTADGAILGTVAVPVASHAQVQKGVFSMITSVPEGQRAPENFYVTWSSTVPIFVYGSVVDSVTGDSVYIE